MLARVEPGDYELRPRAASGREDAARTTA